MKTKSLTVKRKIFTTATAAANAAAAVAAVPIVGTVVSQLGSVRSKFSRNDCGKAAWVERHGLAASRQRNPFNTGRGSKVYQLTRKGREVLHQYDVGRRKWLQWRIAAQRREISRLHELVAELRARPIPVRVVERQPFVIEE